MVKRSYFKSYMRRQKRATKSNAKPSAFFITRWPSGEWIVKDTRGIWIAGGFHTEREAEDWMKEHGNDTIG